MTQNSGFKTVNDYIGIFIFNWVYIKQNNFSYYTIIRMKLLYLVYSYNNKLIDKQIYINKIEIQNNNIHNN